MNFKCFRGGEPEKMEDGDVANLQPGDGAYGACAVMGLSLPLLEVLTVCVVWTGCVCVGGDGEGVGIAEAPEAATEGGGGGGGGGRDAAEVGGVTAESDVDAFASGGPGFVHTPTTRQTSSSSVHYVSCL